MVTTVVPALIDAMVTRARIALPNLLVHDNFGVTDDPGNYLMIGVEDPDVDGFTNSATSQQNWRTIGIGAEIDEEGDIHCAIETWSGDGDEAAQKVVRDAAYAILEQVASMIRTDVSFGVEQVWSTSISETRLSQLPYTSGVAAILLFTVHFKAVI